MSENNKTKSSMLRSFILAAISLAIGLVLILRPDTSSKMIAYVLSGLLALAGLVHVIFDRLRGTRILPFPGLAAGMTAFSIGVFFLIRIDRLIDLLAIVLGIFLVYLGFQMIETSINFKKFQTPRWWLPAIFGIVTLALGFLAMFNVFANSLMVFLGISLMVEAVLLVVSAILFKQVTPPDAPPQAH